LHRTATLNWLSGTT